MMTHDEIAYRMACQMSGRNPAASRAWFESGYGYSARDQFGRLVKLLDELGVLRAEPEEMREVARLSAELQAYRDAALYDALMSGPKFRGWNRSQLDRARKLTEAALAGEAVG